MIVEIVGIIGATITAVIALGCGLADAIHKRDLKSFERAEEREAEERERAQATEQAEREIQRTRDRLADPAAKAGRKKAIAAKREVLERKRSECFTKIGPNGSRIAGGASVLEIERIDKLLIGLADEEAELGE